MFNLIKLNKKVNPIEAIQVLKGGLYRKLEPLGKCPDTCIDIWNLILVTHKNYFLILPIYGNTHHNSTKIQYFC